MQDRSKFWSVAIQAGFFLLAVVTIIWNASQQAGIVKDHERRISAIEQSEASKQEALGRIDARTARIEGQMSLLVDRRP